MTVDYFHDVRYDQLVRKGSVPGIIGIGFSPTNVARTSNKGFDGQINYRGNIRRVNFTTSLVFQHFKNKVLFKDEAQPAFPWLRETGRPIDQPFGYTFIVIIHRKIFRRFRRIRMINQLRRSVNIRFRRVI
ncbi:TonB-dependent receptor [Chitinophaga pinensis]|uniref:TonB-dependent receptor n=1 Tax=Chitinophaga pinensis TaxID=79329 RepID=A0A5C6LJZ4_9BACT|nr:TonB-dependent receptor [Chitinophaga pinensis]TWV95095.1 TonB-dependent receptor [Chitinophaga pinensis]